MTIHVNHLGPSISFLARYSCRSLRTLEKVKIPQQSDGKIKWLAHL